MLVTSPTPFKNCKHPLLVSLILALDDQLTMARSLTENALFSWGFGKYGQLGNGQIESKGLPQRIPFDKGAKPILVSCGGHHTLVGLEHDKRIEDNSDSVKTVTMSSCGRGLYGRLGTGDEKDRASFCVMATSDKTSASDNPVFIAGGHWHSAYITECGSLYIWGYNKAHGVIGIAGLPNYVPIPTPIPMKVCFTHVSCGFNYTLAVTHDHMAFSWGCGRNGVLGQGDRDDRTTPSLIDIPSNIQFDKVSAGYCHSAFVSTSSQLYTCGKGSDGALCHGQDKQDKLVPTHVESLSSVHVLSVGCSQGEHHSHTLIATNDGVYACGDGYKGKLGLGDENSKDLPTKIPSHHFDDCLVTVVSAGGIHSAAVAPDHGVFVWGCGSDGRLGLPGSEGHRYLFRSNVPRKVDLGRWKPLHVSCSYYHTAVVCCK